MKLLKYQKDAYKEFKKTGYIFIDAFRRSGKTELLKHIILNSNINDIGVFCPTYQMFKVFYGKYFSPLGNVYMDFSKKILICDEFFIAPVEGKKIACAITGVPITKWMIDKKELLWDYKELKRIKKQMTQKAYKSEFGNYEIR